MIIDYRGRRIRETRAKDNQFVLYFQENGKAYSLSYQYEAEKPHVIAALKYLIDQHISTGTGTAGVTPTG